MSDYNSSSLQPPTPAPVDDSPLIYAVALVVGGFALQWVNLKSLRSCSNIIGPLYLISLLAVLVTCYIDSLWAQLSPQESPTATNGVTVFYYLCDMVTSFGLDALYIIRLLACTRMYKYHKLFRLLFLFPTVYVIGDCLVLAQIFNPSAFPLSQAILDAPFTCVLYLGNSISHVATIFVLLHDLGNFKDPVKKRNLKIVAAIAVLNQAGLIVTGFTALISNNYSNAVAYLLWTADFIIFHLVNEHIKTFLLSVNLSVAPHRSKSNPRETPADGNGRVSVNLGDDQSPKEETINC
jgi:hypothetical protein